MIEWQFGVGAAWDKTIKTHSCLKLVIGTVVPTLPETEVSESRSGVGSALVSHTADTGSLSGWHLTRRQRPSVPKTSLAMESVEGLRY
jgi:hypothetical protein